MKKMVNISLVYFIFAMAGGVFYRVYKVVRLYGTYVAAGGPHASARAWNILIFAPRSCL